MVGRSSARCRGRQQETRKMNERTQNAEPTPISDFSNCHSGILRGLDAFAELPGLVEAMRRARQVAQQVQAVFEDAVIEHHAQEEKDLFPAVLASAQPGEEREKVKQITDRLTREHREVEAMWKRLAPQVKKVAKGQEVALDVD
ncbi:hemerythrin domain-containing protein, partial [Arthrospira platensis SPKY1]|nr:hemerythrin domain-containing protein [Arthrospira platensis SPKY1]